MWLPLHPPSQHGYIRGTRQWKPVSFALILRATRTALLPDLFGGIALVREWGRLGSPGRLRLDLHPDEDAARRALERLVRLKCRRGYREAA